LLRHHAATGDLARGVAAVKAMADAGTRVTHEIVMPLFKACAREGDVSSAVALLGVAKSAGVPISEKITALLYQSCCTVNDFDTSLTVLRLAVPPRCDPISDAGWTRLLAVGYATFANAEKLQQSVDVVNNVRQSKVLVDAVIKAAKGLLQDTAVPPAGAAQGGAGAQPPLPPYTPRYPLDLGMFSKRQQQRLQPQQRRTAAADRGSQPGGLSHAHREAISSSSGSGHHAGGHQGGKSQAHVFPEALARLRGVLESHVGKLSSSPDLEEVDDAMRAAEEGRLSLQRLCAALAPRVGAPFPKDVSDAVLDALLSQGGRQRLAPGDMEVFAKGVLPLSKAVTIHLFSLLGSGDAGRSEDARRTADSLLALWNKKHGGEGDLDVDLEAFRCE